MFVAPVADWIVPPAAVFNFSAFTKYIPVEPFPKLILEVAVVSISNLLEYSLFDLSLNLGLSSLYTP